MKNQLAGLGPLSAIVLSLFVCQGFCNKVMPDDQGNEQIKEQIIKLEKERNNAFVKKDINVLDRDFANEYSHTNLRGGTTSKAEELKFYGRKEFQLKSATIEDADVRIYGDVVVLLARIIWIDATYRPEASMAVVDLSGTYRITRVYHKKEGRWQVVASHASKLD